MPSALNAICIGSTGIVAATVGAVVADVAVTLGVTADTGFAAVVSVAVVALGDMVDRWPVVCGAATPISRASGARPRGADGAAGVVGVGVAETASEPTDVAVVAAAAISGADAVGDWGAVGACTGVVAVATTAGGALAGAAGVATAVATRVPGAVGRAGELVSAAAELGGFNVTAVPARTALAGLFGAFFCDLAAAVGLCDDSFVEPALSCSAAAVDAWADVAVSAVAEPFVAETPPDVDVVFFADGAVFALDSLSLPAAFGDFVDAAVSAWATPAPDAIAMPIANVAAPVPSHR